MFTTALKNKNEVSLTEARQILGTNSKELSDRVLQNLIEQTELITDIIIHIINDSKIRSSLEKDLEMEDN